MHLLMASGTWGVYRSSSSPEAFVGSGGLLGLVVLKLLDERSDAHVVLVAVLLFALLVVVLTLVLKLREKIVHDPLTLDLLAAASKGSERKRGVDERALSGSLGRSLGKGSEREE
jgi:hypothetical protein